MDSIEKFVRQRDIKMPTIDWKENSAYNLSLDVWNSVFKEQKSPTKSPTKSPLKSPTPPADKCSSSMSAFPSKYKFLPSPKVEHKPMPGATSPGPQIKEMVTSLATNLQSNFKHISTSSPLPVKKNSR